MATPTELATQTNSLTRAETRQLNKHLGGGISEMEIGASSTIQTLASNIKNLVGADRVTFSDELDTASGGSKKSHWPC